MLLNAANVQAIYLGFQTIFQNVLNTATPRYTRIATEVPSTHREESYNWLGKIPRMREWIGERVIQNLSKYDYALKNLPFELTIGVDKYDVEDDSIGLYTPQMQAMAASVAYHPDELVFALLHGGFTGLCFDGQPYFHTDHPDGPNKTTQSNKGTKKLSADSYAEARAQMGGLLDEHGKPLLIVPDLLVVSPAREPDALQILKADIIAATTNTLRGTADVLVLPELAGHPDEWFLLDSKKPVKPFIFQNRRAPEFVTMTKPDDENVFMKKELLFGAERRDNAGYGLWQLAYGSDGTE